jgi:hypothetical protein
MGAIKVKAQFTQRTRSRLARAQPRAKAADPEGFTSRPRAPQATDTHLRLARGPVFAEKQPWPDRHANRPYRKSI